MQRSGALVGGLEGRQRRDNKITRVIDTRIHDTAQAANRRKTQGREGEARRRAAYERKGGGGVKDQSCGIAK